MDLNRGYRRSLRIKTDGGFQKIPKLEFKYPLGSNRKIRNEMLIELIILKLAYAEVIQEN